MEARGRRVDEGQRAGENIAFFSFCCLRHHLWQQKFQSSSFDATWLVSLWMSSTIILTIPPSSWGASNQYSPLAPPRLPSLSHAWVLCSPNHLRNEITSSNLLFSLLSGFCIFFVQRATKYQASYSAPEKQIYQDRHPICFQIALNLVNRSRDD